MIDIYQNLKRVAVSQISEKSLGTNTEGDRTCFSISQTGGFCVCRSSFFVHLTNFLFRDSGKTSHHFESFVWRFLSQDIP